MFCGQFRVVCPSSFKQTIGEFQPRFAGYQQQDSSELITFILDGLHEDLNRVKKKPQTPSVESRGRPDAVVATEAWERHLLRNQSFIVDTLQGQWHRVVQPCLSLLHVPLCSPFPVSSSRTTEVASALPQVQQRQHHLRSLFLPPCSSAHIEGSATAHGHRVSR